MEGMISIMVEDYVRLIEGHEMGVAFKKKAIVAARAAIDGVYAGMLAGLHTPDEGSTQTESEIVVDVQLFKPGRRWTPEENLLAMDAVKAGQPYETIASAHGRTPGAIRSRALHNATNAVIAGQTVIEAATEFHVSELDVTRYINKKNTK